MKNFRLSAIAASFAVVIGAASSVHAGGFQLFEQSAAGLGTGQATAGASANDASTEYTNPAGMVRLKKGQFTSGLEMISLTSKFTGTTDTILEGGSTNPQTGTADASTPTNMVPNIHFVTPLTDKLYYGAGLTVPFGLATDYGNDSIAAQYATYSYIETKNISQDLAYAITPEFSFGAGLDFQQFKGEFDTEEAGSLSDNNGATSSAIGWHAGILYQFTPATRVGLAYHSSITQKASGKGIFAGSTITDIKTNFVLPAWFTLGLHQDINKRLSVMGTVNYTLWSKVKDLTVENIYFVSAPKTVVTPMNFRNTWEASVGTEYKFTPKWQGKFGVGYDQTPTVNAHRELRLPDGNKINVAIGAHYQASTQVGFDFGYEHAFVQNASINTNIALPDLGTLTNNAYYLNGTTKGSADIFGFQATYDF